MSQSFTKSIYSRWCYVLHTLFLKRESLHLISVHVQSICDAVDVPHLETHPTLDSALFRGANVFLNRSSSSSIVPTNLDQRFSINVHPRLEDINVAFRDLVLYKKWPKAALLYTGMRDGDGSGASTFHLQHMLLQNDVDCLTRRLPAIYDVSVSYSYVGISWMLSFPQLFEAMLI